MDGSLSCALYLVSEPISVLCLAARDGTLWMYFGADGLFVLLGADDECGYQLRPLCSDPVGLHPIVRALPALGSPRLPAGVTSGSSLLLPFLIHPRSEFLGVYL